MRDAGSFNLREKIVEQIKTVNQPIKNLQTNIRSTREGLIVAADEAIRVLKGTKSLLEELRDKVP